MAVPKAVEKTIKAVVNALILPIYLTPYISAQVEEPRTLARPLEIPTRPKKMKEIIVRSKIYNNIKPNNKGIFIK
jgi:hypothetical protein